jgi:hypothetical protein
LWVSDRIAASDQSIPLALGKGSSVAWAPYVPAWRGGSFQAEAHDVDSG